MSSIHNANFKVVIPCSLVGGYQILLALLLTN